jgi:hypothetical protein
MTPMNSRTPTPVVTAVDHLESYALHGGEFTMIRDTSKGSLFLHRGGSPVQAGRLLDGFRYVRDSSHLFQAMLDTIRGLERDLVATRDKAAAFDEIDEVLKARGFAGATDGETVSQIIDMAEQAEQDGADDVIVSMSMVATMLREIQALRGQVAELTGQPLDEQPGQVQRAYAVGIDVNGDGSEFGMIDGLNPSLTTMLSRSYPEHDDVRLVLFECSSAGEQEPLFECLPGSNEWTEVTGAPVPDAAPAP